MDPERIRSWIAAQIEEHAPTSTGTLTTASRLADAAAALRPGSHKAQVFGLAVTQRDESFAPLYTRCLALLAEWAKVLEPPLAAELTALMRSLQLPIPAGAEPTPAPTTVATLRVVLPVELERFDEEANDHVPVVGATALAALDGVRARGGDRLFEIACMRAATAGTFELEGVQEDYGWAHGSSVTLRHEPAADALRCHLVCELNRVPRPVDVERLLATIEKELFFTGWGTNLDWEGADDVLVHVDSRPLAHELVPV